MDEVVAFAGSAWAKTMLKKAAGCPASILKAMAIACSSRTILRTISAAEASMAILDILCAVLSLAEIKSCNRPSKVCIFVLYFIWGVCIRASFRSGGHLCVFAGERSDELGTGAFRWGITQKSLLMRILILISCLCFRNNFWLRALGFGV